MMHKSLIIVYLMLVLLLGACGSPSKSGVSPNNVSTTNSLKDCKLESTNLTQKEEDVLTVLFQKNDDDKTVQITTTAENSYYSITTEPCSQSTLSNTTLFQEDGFSDAKLITYTEGESTVAYEVKIDNKSYFFKPFDFFKAFQEALGNIGNL